MNLDAYLDEAKRRQGITSERALARALGISAPSLIQWRSGIASPRPALMVRIAEMAGMPPELAMMDRLAWQADDAASRDIVARMRAALQSSIAAMVLILCVLQVTAAPDTRAEEAPLSQYYGKLRLWKTLLKLSLNPAPITAAP